MRVCVWGGGGFTLPLILNLSVSFSPSCVEPPEQTIRYQDFRQDLKPPDLILFTSIISISYFCFVSFVLLVCVSVCVCLHDVFLLCSDGEQLLHVDTPLTLSYQRVWTLHVHCDSNMKWRWRQTFLQPHREVFFVWPTVHNSDVQFAAWWTVAKVKLNIP